MNLVSYIFQSHRIDEFIAIDGLDLVEEQRLISGSTAFVEFEAMIIARELHLNSLPF